MLGTALVDWSRAQFALTAGYHWIFVPLTLGLAVIMASMETLYVQLQWAKDAGYKTCFWSLAYVDWDEKKQPSKEEAMDKLTKRIHPGAIVLLHSTSSTNGEILGDIIKEWKKMGYSFGELNEL